MIGQLPRSSGRSLPSHISFVDAFATRVTELQADLRVRSRVHEIDDALPRDDVLAAYMPAQPGEMRPSRETSVISAMTSPAPPIARAPRCAKWKSFGVPSLQSTCTSATRRRGFGACSPRSENGVNIGGRSASA